MQVEPANEFLSLVNCIEMVSGQSYEEYVQEHFSLKWKYITVSYPRAQLDRMV